MHPKINIWASSSAFVSSSIPSWQILTAHAQPFSGARDLAFCLKVPLDSLLVSASSWGSGETAQMRRLAWTFTARIGDKYQICLMRPICEYSKSALIKSWNKEYTIIKWWTVSYILITNYSKNGKQAFFGMENGAVRIQNLLLTRDLSELGPYWCLNMHDSLYGHVTGIVQSFDETSLISTGADGNFFQYSIMGQEQLEKKIAENKAKIPSARVSKIVTL